MTQNTLVKTLSAGTRGTTLLTTLGGIILAGLAAVLAWLTTEFLGRPFRHFFDLRRDVVRALVKFDNVAARAKMEGDLRKPIDISQPEDDRLTEAQNTFRDLASQMRAFARAEPLAASVVKRLFRYDAFEISKALIGYSNEVSTYGAGRAGYEKRIEKLLNIRTVD